MFNSGDKGHGQTNKEEGKRTLTKGMEKASYEIRQMTKEIVIFYVNYIQDKVEKREPTVMHLGVDDSFENYANLYEYLLGETLGVETSTHITTVPPSFLKEFEEGFKKEIGRKRHKRLEKDEELSKLVYQVCLYILKSTEEENEDLL